MRNREVFGFLGFGLERKLSENFTKNQGMSDLAVPLKSHQVGHEVVGLTEVVDRLSMMPS